MPKCYQLVGVPGSGKTTWIKNQDWTVTCAYISTDKWIEIFAQEIGSTYSQVFETFMPTAVDCMAKEVMLARDMGRDIVWDQTSTTVQSRLKKFRMLPDYEHIAVVFKTPDDNELTRRLSSRPGKIIPDTVIGDMIDKFQMPTVDEGFSEIWHVG